MDELKSAKEVWDTLTSVFQDKGASRKVNLLKQWISLKAENCGSLQEYVHKSVALRAKVKTVGFDISDEIAGSIVLCGLGTEYNSLVMSLEGKGGITFDGVKNDLLQTVDFVDVSENALVVKPRNGNNLFNNKKVDPVKCYDCGGPHYKRNCRKNKNKHQSKKTEKSECVLYIAFSTNNHVDKEWYVDSGATRHMTHIDFNLENIRKPLVKQVKAASGEKIDIHRTGNLKCEIDGANVELRDVQYIPGLCVNLLSVSQIVKNGCTVIFNADGCKIFSKNNDLLATGSLIDDMFKINIKTNELACISANTKSDDLTLWHRRLGHTNFETLKKLLNVKMTIDKKCEICVLGEHSRKPFNEPGKRASKILELIHSDVCGPITTSFGGMRYFVTFLDDFSRKVFVYPMKSKGEVFSKFVEFKKRYEKETERAIKTLRSDNGGEYVNKTFEQFFAKCGIKHERTAPYSPQQNGMAERLNRSIIEKVRCMLLEAKLGKHFWAEAVCAAADIMNILPNVNDVSPSELFCNKKQNIQNFKVFGCKAMVWKPDQKRTKLDAKLFSCIFLRYADNAKTYRLYDTKAKKLVISRDVVFFENENGCEMDISNENYHLIDRSEEACEEIIDLGRVNDENESTITENDEEEVQNDDETSAIDVNDTNESFSHDASGTGVSSTDDSSVTDDASGTNESILQNDNNTTGSSNGDYDDAEENDQDTSVVDDVKGDPNFGTRVDKNLDGSKTRNMMKNLLNFHMAFVMGEPTNYRQALVHEKCDEWKRAMKEEYDSLIKNETWELVDKPKDAKIVDNKWVYKVKLENNNQTRYKARLVARGFTQEYGVNYYETFSPVVRFTSIRTILAIAAKRDMHMKQFDVKTAFLNGDLMETVYMEQPIGFDDGSKRVCKLKKSLYGLKQSSRCCNEKFSTFIKLFGFKQCKLDPCVYIGKLNGALTIKAIHVDDGLIVGESLAEIKSVIKYLCEKFEIKEMAAGCFLGLEIQKRADKSIFVHQSTYAKKVLNRFNMQNCNTVSTPSDTNQQMHNFDESDASKYPYRELIGSLMYLAIGTRPGIMHAVGIASRYMERPTIVHENAAKRILKYLKRTLNFGILFCSDKENELNAYSDADYAGDVDSRRSTTGYVFMFGGGAISWCSERQKSVSLSTTESEYMAASQCVKEMVWLRGILNEILDGKLSGINFFMDNQSAICLIKNPEFHKRSKHIDVRYHFIREKYEENLFILKYISTKQMIADIFTKSLPAKEFNELTKKMGVVNVE